MEDKYTLPQLSLTNNYLKSPRAESFLQLHILANKDNYSLRDVVIGQVMDFGNVFKILVFNYSGDERDGKLIWSGYIVY